MLDGLIASELKIGIDNIYVLFDPTFKNLSNSSIGKTEIARHLLNSKKLF